MDCKKEPASEHCHALPRSRPALPCPAPAQPVHRLALITAAKAVAFALTPGLEPIKSVTMWSGRRGLGPSVDFIGECLS